MEPTGYSADRLSFSDDDISLMLRVQQDDMEAFALLAGRYRGRLKRFFKILLPDATQADDFAQETLLRLWLARKQYQPTGNFSAYLFQIGRHFYLNHRIRQQERKRRESSADDLSQALVSASSHQLPENVVLVNWEEEKRRLAIAALPEIYRTIFVLSHFEDWKYSAIAEHLNIPVGTVKSRMAEAVRRLRLALTPEENS